MALLGFLISIFYAFLVGFLIERRAWGGAAAVFVYGIGMGMTFICKQVNKGR